MAREKSSTVWSLRLTSASLPRSAYPFRWKVPCHCRADTGAATGGRCRQGTGVDLGRYAAHRLVLLNGGVVVAAGHCRSGQPVLQLLLDLGQQVLVGRG